MYNYYTSTEEKENKDTADEKIFNYFITIIGLIFISFLATTGFACQNHYETWTPFWITFSIVFCILLIIAKSIAIVHSIFKFKDDYPSESISSIVKFQETYLDIDLLYKEKLSLNPFSENNIQLIECTVHESTNPHTNQTARHFLSKLKNKKIPILTYIVSGYFDSETNNISGFEAYIEFKGTKWNIFKIGEFESSLDDFENLFEALHKIFGIYERTNFSKNWSCLKTYSHKNVAEKYLSEHFKNLANNYSFVKSLNKKEKVKNFLIGCIKLLGFDFFKNKKKYVEEAKQAFEKSLVKVNI